MREIDLAGGLVCLEHREVDNPGKAEDRVVDQPLFLADAHPRTARQAGGGAFVGAGEEHGIAVADTGGDADFLSLLRAKRLGHRAASLAVAIDDIAHARRAFGLRPAVHPVGNGTAAAFRARHRAHHAAVLDRLGEDRETGSTEGLGHIADFDGNPQVGLVVAVFQHRLGKGDMDEFLVDRLVGKLLEHAADHRFDGIEHILLLDKAHLEVELVEFARAAIGAAVLVAETGRNLEIAVKSGHHHQLLELLRRLRQRIELAGMKACRHQEVARALRRRGRQDRRLEFGETLRHHAGADRLDDLGTQHDVVMRA